MITTAQLNAVATLIGTTDKKAVFAACIKTLMESGMSARAAMEFVCGKHNVDAVIDSVYNELRAS